MELQVDIGLTVYIDAWDAEPEHGIPRPSWAIDRVFLGDTDITNDLSTRDMARIGHAVERELRGDA